MNAPVPTPAERRFRIVGTATVGVVIFLILIGGIVRSTGSGMGCPDWPKCFGMWVPPIDVSEIPPSFFESHPDYTTKEFVAFQTWTEYINRLIGAVTGLFVLATALLSLPFWKRRKSITLLSVGAVLLTGFQGWLGKVVVDKNLEGMYVTLHMLVALVILAMLLTAVYLAVRPVQGERRTRSNGVLQWAAWAVLVATTVQLLVGTQVREHVDAIAESMDGEMRSTWVAQLGAWFSFHKVFWVMVALAVSLWVRSVLQEKTAPPWVRRVAISLLVALFAEVALGILLAAFALPPVLQPLHLLVASLMFTFEYLLLLYGMRFEWLFLKNESNSGKIKSWVNE